MLIYTHISEFSSSQGTHGRFPTLSLYFNHFTLKLGDAPDIEKRALHSAIDRLRPATANAQARSGKPRTAGAD